MGSTNGFLLVCMLLLQSVVFVHSNCDTEVGSGNCRGSGMTISKVKTFSTSGTSKSGNKTTTFKYVHKTGSGAEGSSYSYEAHHTHTTSSSSSYSQRSASNTMKTVRVTVTGSPQSLPKENTERDAVASQSAASNDGAIHVVEAAEFVGLEAEAPASYGELAESSSMHDEILEDPSNPSIDCPHESISDFFSIEPVVFVEHVSAPSPSPSAEPVAVVEVPIEFYPCGYPKPVHPKQHDSNPSVHSDVPTQTYPCPHSHTEPEPVPLPPEKPVSSPVPVAEPVVSLPPPSPQHSPVIEKAKESTSDSKVLAKRVRDLIEMGNITGLAEVVIESDDIYGLNKGLRFSDDEREEALEKTEQRADDKDVIVLKALAQAALSPEAKGKVVQLMIVTATGPNGYNFSQHRSLVERFEEIFADSELLHEVIDGNPQTYSKRRLHCSGCTPVNSYICAYCWPSQVCGAYFWCPETKPSSDQSSKKSETDNSKTEAEIEEPAAAVSEPAPRSRSIEGDIERAAAIEDGDKRSSKSHKTKSKKDSKRKSKSTKGRGKQRNRKRGHHRRTDDSPSLKTGSNKNAHRDQ